MSTLSNALAKLARASWRDRGLLVEAAAWLAVARLAILALPFRRIAPRLGRAMNESPASEPRLELGRRVGWAISVASRYAPWRTRCLEQAVAAKAMLRRRGVASTLYLGLARRDAGGEAHAWLRCGETILTGGAEVSGYAVVAKFAE